MKLQILGRINNIETFARGKKIRELVRLQEIYGNGKWRKRKGIARIKLPDGNVRETS